MASTDPQVNSSSQDLVALLRQSDFTQLFETANPMQVSVKETAKITGFAVEDGTRRSDSIVYDPVEVTMPFLLTDDTRATFENMRQAFKTQAEIIVQTKVSSYRDMCIFEFPHEESPELGEAITLTIKLREIKVVRVEFGALPPSSVKNKTQASTVPRGNQQTSESDAPTKRKASVLAGLF